MTLLTVRPRVRRAAVALLTTGFATAAVAVGAAPALADTKPATGTATTVSTDVLPTAQLNGVAWNQIIVGSTVYVGGDFTKARPAGAPAGTGEVNRGGMLAYNITTGQLTGFAPSFNAAVRGLAASSDGKTIYAVGNFTTVNGVARSRIVALNASTGAVISSFAPTLNSTGLAVAVHNTTVYAAGAFTAASGQTRSHAAAFASATGALTKWAPTTDQTVRTLLASPDGASVVLGGHFATVNGATTRGSARVDSSSGKSNLSWAINGVVQNNGPDSAIYSLTTDGTYVYATGYSFHPTTAGAKLEGAYAASWSGGSIRWIEDCHGDSYSSAVSNGALYVASHAHYCANVPGGFPQVLNPDGTYAHFQRGTAFSLTVAGTLRAENSGYSNYGGRPAPGLLDWFPDINTGTYTGQNQGAWSVAANSQYVVYGGEFTKVNGVAQQGLVRFAVPSIAPNHDGPRLVGASFVPTLTAPGGGKVTVQFLANYDRDNESQSYGIYRDGNTSAPVATLSAKSRIWYQRPNLTWTNTGLAVGSTHSYRIKTTDPWGNVVWGNTVSITVK